MIDPSLFKNLLKVIEENSDENGFCYLKSEEIGKKIFYSAPYINVLLKELREWNVISVEYFKQPKRYNLTRKIKIIGEI